MTDPTGVAARRSDAVHERCLAKKTRAGGNDKGVWNERRSKREIFFYSSLSNELP